MQIVSYLLFSIADVIGALNIMVMYGQQKLKTNVELKDSVKKKLS